MNSKVAEIMVSYQPKIISDLKLGNSKDSYNLIMKNWDEGKIEMQEEVKLILLNRSNKVLGIYQLATGGITSCVVDIRLILSVALKTLATGIIMVHNHPSGNLKPSSVDIKITESLKSACKLLQIDFLDHLIIIRNSYFSFADDGML